MSSLLPLLLLMAEVDLPGTSSVSEPLASPSSCRNCHGSFDPEAAHESWLGSPMGHAARNPLFLAALSLNELDRPNTGDFCLRCHAPEAWLSGKCIEPDGSLLTDEDDGVSCTLCHRMDPSPWLKNGQYTIGEDIIYRGPYADATPPHRFQQGTWISTSELCGSCHDLFNPLVTRRGLDGTPMDGALFPEQTTYSEWAASSVSATRGCKDCHMPESVGPIAGGQVTRSDRSSHEFSGGNLFLLRSIDFLEPGLGLSTQLERGRMKIEAQLRRAATLELVDPPAELRRGEPFTLTFRVTNTTGHKLPTGYPEGRRVWLSIASTELGIDRGAYDQALGEPIDPAAIYHVKQGQFGIGPGHHIALNDVVFLDTRIPPEGMTVTATLAPVGKTFAEVAPGVLAHWDEVTITATTPCDIATATAAINLRAALWYQSVTSTYARALVEENGDEPRSLRLATAYEEADPGPFEMVMIAENLPIAAGSSCTPLDAGFADTGITDAGDRAPDAEVTPDAGSKNMVSGGCGCRATQAPDGLSGLGLVVLLLGLATRKRR